MKISDKVENGRVKALLFKCSHGGGGNVWFSQIVVMFLLLCGGEGQANPRGGVVTAGSAEIIASELDPSFLQIIQSSNKAIINWQDFSIGAGEHTQFVQPSQMAAILNRVVSGNPSAIAGLMSSNGKVLVVNQNGIVVTPSGVIDTAGGLVLSTLDIKDADFLNGMDDSFLGTTAAGVTNYGTIMSAGGDVVLLGDFVDNAGIIGAPDGTVALGAGGNIVVHSQGENKISVQASGVGAATGVNNSGSITGAAAELKAHGNVYALAINNSGIIRATGSQVINGRVMLTSRSADGKTGGDIENTGEIKANNVDGSGGFIMIDGGPGSNVGILGGKISTNGIGNTVGGDVVMIGQTINIAQGVEVTANGTDGGTILIGSAEDTQAVSIGGTVSANGSSGNGGSVMVLGDSTSVLSVSSSGRIEATGGQNGGLVTMQGGTINTALGSVIDAGGGVNGGSVAIIGQDASGAVNLNGTINAVGGSGVGGVISATGAGNVNVGADAMIAADGASGGLVIIDAESTTTQAGTITALGSSGKGGIANVTGANVVVAVQATMDVSGLTGGGQINVGGGFQGRNDSLRNSDSTVVGGLAILKADAVNTGDAGQVVVWSDGDTIFGGEIRARALGTTGRGGLVEISGKRNLTYNGVISATSVSGNRGTVLFDPGDVNVGDGASSLPIAGVNAILDSNTNLIISTENGDIVFDSLSGNFRDVSVQWNTDASLGIFASGDVRFLNSVRTAGAGSINVIAGWTGAESDPEILSNDPAAAWDYYVNGAAAGSFGIGGNVYINDAANNRAVEVGSRYGKTQVAANNVFITAAPTGRGRYAQLGFKDNGQVFFFNDAAHQTDGVGVTAGSPLVGLVGVNETTIGGEVGVRMFNASSADGLDVDGVGGIHFLEYADNFDGKTSESNWWWRSLDGKANGSSGVGDNLPEMGAGISDELLAIDTYGGLVKSKADINIEARGALILRAGRYDGSADSNYAQIGHGGSAYADRGGNLRREDLNKVWAMNWGNANNSGTIFSTAIGRLAPVYSDINIRTGLVENGGNGVLEASSAAGIVSLAAPKGGGTVARTINNYVQIGHMGVNQAGSVEGRINIVAGGAVGVESGLGWTSSAVIGHAVSNVDDLRAGKGLVKNTGVTPDGKFGGGLHKQFRIFANNLDYNSLNKEDLAGYALPDLGVGIYDGNTEVTGAGADVFSNLSGDILVKSVTGDVIVKGAVGDPNIARERVSNSVARIGHGALFDAVMYRVNVRGDIVVDAFRDLSVIAGNGAGSPAQIGFYGGNAGTVSDYLAGDIVVKVGRNMVVEGGGRTRLFPRATGGDSGNYKSYALVGHGGIESNSTFKNGDITVTVGGGLTMTGGGYGGAFSQIGHGGKESRGQVGGEYSRTILIADEGSDGVRNVNYVTSNMGVGDAQLDPNMTANIVVTVDGDIVMDHLKPNDPFVEYTVGTQIPAKMDMDDAYTLIGHGGADTTQSTSNALLQYVDKTGDVTVNTSGSLTMESGGGTNGWYTRIGHGANRNDRQVNNREATYSGDVTVYVDGGLKMDANVSDNEFGRDNGNGTFSHFASANPVAIGNGGTRNGNFVNFSGAVVVNVGGDASMISGKGLEASFVQIGNGGAGSLNTNPSVDDTGQFTGDVTVNVEGALEMTANPDGEVYILDPTNFNNFGKEVTNSYVLIGNGGAYWETSGGDVAVIDGDVTVSVGTDLTMTAGLRSEAAEMDGGGNFASLVNSFVQIGNSNSGTGANSDGATGTANGDVTVVVGNDLQMVGGKGGNTTDAPNLAASVMIGNGGAEMDGAITGDIVVKVGNNLTTEDGEGDTNSSVKIGHGDWMRDTPTLSGTGSREGDITVYVGNTASFDRTLVGHRDMGAGFPTSDTTGATIIGVSRNNPFFGGSGMLIDSNASGNGGSVFTSGSQAGGFLLDELRFYMPGRSSNGLLVGLTRLNSGTVTFVGNEGGLDFVAPTQAGVRGVMAPFQREDEIYLQPDWWADAIGLGGGAFPDGSMAEVDTPGGFDNLLSAVAGGNLGAGTSVNAHGELAYLTPFQNSLGNYTFYYDAIAPVAAAPLAHTPSASLTSSNLAGVPNSSLDILAIIDPFVPDVGLFNFLFFNQSGADLFGYSERDYLIMGDIVDGGGDVIERKAGQKPHWLFGVADRALTPEEEARENRRRARYTPQLNNGGGRVYWSYDLGGHRYSSFRVFGDPKQPAP